MLPLVLSLLILAGLFGIGYGIRAVWQEMEACGKPEAKTTEERKNERIRKDMEKWRDVK